MRLFGLIALPNVSPLVEITISSLSTGQKLEKLGGKGFDRS
jgi:hypothetical protein